MELEELKNQLNAISLLTDEAWNDLKALFRQKELERNEHLIRQGERQNDCYFLIEGIIRVYYITESVEYNKTFFTAGMFPTPLTALLSQKPCQLNFQALTDCKLISFSFKGFRELFDKHRCIEQFMLRILEREWIKKEEHDIRMVTNDATTNYLLFQEEHTGLEQLIPQYHIASYLGITPIQLSRIRKQLLSA